MKIEGRNIIFNSDADFFNIEKDGFKPNTVRLLDFLPKIEDIRSIKIVHRYSGAHFTRILTDISCIGYLTGLKIVVFSWNPSEVIL